MSRVRHQRFLLAMAVVVFVVCGSLVTEYQSQPHPPDCATATESHPLCEDAGDARKHLAGFVVIGAVGIGVSLTVLIAASRRRGP